LENSINNKSVWVVIPASGVGSRMNSDIPKQYLQVQGKTILEHTVFKFAALRDVVGVLVIISKNDTHWTRVKDNLLLTCQSQGLHFVSCFGGGERSDTVLKGLSFLINELKLNLEQWVMVHDAARPCVREKDIVKLLEARADPDSEGAILAIPVKDTLKQADKDKLIIQTLSRECLWQAQTPQLFQLGNLYDALHNTKHARISITDEASAMEYDNKSVRLIEGSSDNIKLTTPSDLKIIDFLLSDPERKNEY